MKKFISILLAVLVSILAVYSLFGCNTVATGSNVKDYGEYEDGNFFINVKQSENFKILYLADTQMLYNNIEKDSPSELTLRLIDTVIKNTKPDLVAIAGDITNKAWEPKADQMFLLKKIGDIMIDNNVLWTMVFGNHDSEATDKLHPTYPGNELTKSEVIKELRKGYSNLLMAEGDSSVEGVGNFYINIVKKNKIIKTLYNFDCVRDDISYSDTLGGIFSKTPYKPMTISQADWYKNSCEKNKALNGGEYPQAFLMAHVMTNSGYNAFSEGSVEYGEWQEGEPAKGDGFDAFEKLEEYMTQTNALAYFAGHHHKNDYSAILKNIRYTFIQHGSYCNYYKDNRDKTMCTRGGTLVTLQGDSGYKCEQVLIKNIVDNYDWNKNISFII